MLKIDCLSLAKNDFSLAELNHMRGDAVVKVGEDFSASGKFFMSNSGVVPMCTINAAGVLPEDGVTIDSPDALTVELVGSFERRCFVAAGSDTVSLRCSELLIPAAAGDPETEVYIGSKKCTVGNKDSDGFYTITVDPCPFKDRVLTVKLVNVPVATGAAADSNVNHKLLLKADNDEKVVHFSMLCNVGRATGRKPNKTSFEVRGARPWKKLGAKTVVDFKYPAAAATVSSAAEGGEGEQQGGNGNTQNPPAVNPDDPPVNPDDTTVTP